MAYTNYTTKGNKMHKRVNISIDEELNERWNKVVEKHGLVKSLMVRNFLLEVLPIWEAKEPHVHIQKIVEEMMEENKTKSLFEAMEHDQSVEDYKEAKRA